MGETVLFSSFPYNMLKIGSVSPAQVNDGKFCSGKLASE